MNFFKVLMLVTVGASLSVSAFAASGTPIQGNFVCPSVAGVNNQVSSAPGYTVFYIKPSSAPNNNQGYWLYPGPNHHLGEDVKLTKLSSAKLSSVYNDSGKPVLGVICNYEIQGDYYKNIDFLVGHWGSDFLSAKAINGKAVGANSVYACSSSKCVFSDLELLPYPK